MIKPNEVVVVDYKKLNLNGSLALVAQMGAGKNVDCIEPWFADAMHNEKMPIYMAPLKSLLDKSLGTNEHYQSLIDNDNPRKGLRTTVNSFVLGQFAEFRKYNKVLFIDEVVRLIEQLNGNAFLSGSMEDKLFGWKMIFSAIKNAENVVLADAHLGQSYLDIIEELTGKVFPAYTTASTDYSKIKAAIGYKTAELISIVKSYKEQGIKSSYFYDGKIEDGKALEATFIKSGLKAIYLYSAERNIAGSEVLEASKHPELLAGYDVVICSPHIGPGWACVVSEFKAVMIHCCGTISPASVIQGIKRFRAVDNVHIAYDLRFARRNHPEDELSVSFMMAANEVQIEAINVTDTWRAAKDYIKDATGRTICKMIALENYSRNHFEFFIHKAVQTLGFELEVVDGNTQIAGNESKKLRTEKDLIAEEKANFFRDENVLDDKKLASLKTVKKNVGTNIADSWMIERSEAVLLMNKKGLLTEVEIDFLLNKNGAALIKKCEILAGNGKKTLANLVIAELFKDLLDFVNNRVYTTATINAFIQKLKSNKLKWNGMLISKFTLLTKTIFEVKGVSGGGYVAAKNILKTLLGFEMSSSPCKTVGKYVVDSSIFDMANSYIKKVVDPEFDLVLLEKNKLKMDELKAMIHESKSARVNEHEAVPA